MSSGLAGQDPWLGRLSWKKRLPESLAVKCYCQYANQKIEYPSASLNLTISRYPSVKARWKFPIIRNIWKHLETAKCKDMLCCLFKGRGWTAFGSCRSWLIGICPRVQFHEHTYSLCLSHDVAWQEKMKNIPSYRVDPSSNSSSNSSFPVHFGSPSGWISTEVHHWQAKHVLFTCLGIHLRLVKI